MPNEKLQKSGKPLEKKAQKKGATRAKAKKIGSTPNGNDGTELANPSILAWEDDPRSQGGLPVSVPLSVKDALGLNFSLLGVEPKPGQYLPGTFEFRYWNAHQALNRCISYWVPLLPVGAKWVTGASIPVNLEKGQSLNASYDQKGLQIFWDAVAGKKVYTGESPDILCHEMGHAILDILKPELFQAPLLEVAAFHESFSDISALFSALQQPSFCKFITHQSNGDLRYSSRLSRIAEEVGWALNLRRPDLASPMCLRDAVNSFFYISPDKLLPSGPDSTLTAEPHNFSRVFTGGLFDAFVRRGILPLDFSSSLVTLGTTLTETKQATSRSNEGNTHRAILPAKNFGFHHEKLYVDVEPNLTMLAMQDLYSVNNPDPEVIQFISYLFQRGRVEMDASARKNSELGMINACRTHSATLERGYLVLRRKCFDCGFD